MINSGARALSRLIAYAGLTFPLMPVQALFILVSPALARRFPHVYHRIVCRIMGIELDVRGTISQHQPTLFVSNHISYLDIEALSAAVPTCFVAKREVGEWPIFGWLAKLQRTVFVERRSSAVKQERDELARRLEEGDNVVLFPEGTSGDGNRLRPFKSALLSAAERRVAGQPLVIQPITVAYTRLDGLPIGRQWRPFFAWYGAMDMASHLWAAIGIGRITVTLEFHPPVTFDQFGSRKALAAYCQAVIARGLESANCGRPVPPLAATPALPATRERAAASP